MRDQTPNTIDAQHDETLYSRRSFCKLIGVGAVASSGLAAFGASDAASGIDQGLRWTELQRTERGFWKRVKHEFVLDRRVTYMNVGTTGSMPRAVLRAYADNAALIARDPRENLGGSTAMREALAPQFGCNPDELVISNNTTDGVCMTLNGVTLGPGDEVITTNHEHPSADAPLALLRDRAGVKLIEVALPIGDNQTAQDYVDLFADAITPKTKMFVFSAPTYVTGTMLPIRRLADLAIDHGIHTLVDGAHATGMFNLDLHALGVDFFAGSGHKWQCGPGGTGIWFIRNQTDSNPLELPLFYPTRTLLYNTFPPFFPGGGFPDGSRGGPGDDVAFANQLHGNPNYAAYQALVDASDFWSIIGRQRIEDYILSLSADLKERLIAYWGVDALYSPREPELSSALTAFTPFPDDRKNTARSNEFVTRLREEYGFVVRNTGVHIPGEEDDRPIRISTHLFHDRSDIDQVVEAMIDLSTRMGA